MIKKEPLITDLVGAKTTKTDLKLEFFGSIDEAQAFMMDLTHYVDNQKITDDVMIIAKTLSVMLAEIAGGNGKITEKELNELLNMVDYYQQLAGPFKCFIIPGKTKIGSKANICRVIIRRAERAYARLFEANGGSKIIFEYLNKLSTLFYAICRIYDEKQ